jgi:DNA polymerase-3 subunit alpha
MGAEFIHLHTHSAYSLAEGAIPVKTLVKKARAMKMPALAMTDTGNLFGAMEFSLEAAKAGLQPILGAQILIGSEEHQLVLLVQSAEGYLNLSVLISQSYLTSDGLSKPKISWEDLQTHHTGLICLSGGVKGPVGQAVLHNRLEEADRLTQDLKRIFSDRLYMEIQRHGTPEEESSENGLVDLAYRYDIPLLATNDVYFSAPDLYEAHDALLCIAEGRYVTESDRRKVTREHYFRTPAEMVDLFSDLPEAIQNTLVVAQRCYYFLKVVNPILPPFQTESGRSEEEELKAQAREGLEWRLQNFVFADKKHSSEERESLEKTYRDRLEFELNTITDMGFSGYFLIVSDFIKWAKNHNIPVGPGRGSGAGSLVAWSLKITDLDPIRFGLLFERFLNPERVSMPDFDVDFCQDRRDEVIHYVQSRYGHDHVAQIITFGKLQARAVVRDVGRVLQMPYSQVDRISKMIPNNPASPVTLAEALEADPELQAKREDEQIDRLLTIALQLEGLYRHASTHAAGVVIGDRPLQQLVPLYRDPRSDVPATQFNMKYVEQAGLVKYDFLGLKTLTVILKAVEMIAARGTQIDILKIPLDDAKTYEMLSAGQSVAVFQLESSGMRDVLRKMKPNRFEDIIALVALYRPGPMDNIPKYISVKDGKEEADYLHPKLRPMLEETYGIMVYQEQVMQAAQILSGYTLGGADLLRRAMGKKIKEEMDAQRALFVEGAAKTSGVDAEQATAIFEQIEKFAGYGFNKSHAAAYALVAYQTAWLKANYPVEFMAATMTLDMGNTDKLAVFRQALSKMDISLLPPDVNKSEVEFSVEGSAIRYALAAIKGVGTQAMEVLVEDRRRNGPFASLEDFLKRMDSKTLNKKQFENLVAAGGLDSIHASRAQLFVGAESLVHYAAALAEERKSNQSSLFAMEQTAAKDLDLHHLPQVVEWSPLEKLSYEFQAIGFYLSAHPLDTKRAQLERLHILAYGDLDSLLLTRSSARVQIAGVLIKKTEKMSTKSGNKFAFLSMSDSSGVYEVMVFSETLQRSRALLEAGNALLLTADVEYKEDQIRLTVQDIKLLDESLVDKVTELKLALRDASGVSQLKEVLKNAGSGRSRVVLVVPAENSAREVEIRLSGFYSFSPELRESLFRVPGMISVSEA